MGPHLFFCFPLQIHLDPFFTQSIFFDRTVLIYFPLSFQAYSIHWTFTVAPATAGVLLSHLSERKVYYHPLFISLNVVFREAFITTTSKAGSHLLLLSDGIYHNL